MDSAESDCKRTKREHLHRIACRDLWDADNACAMVETLYWACEELLMNEAIRFILCFELESCRLNDVVSVGGDSSALVQRWWNLYCTIPVVAKKRETGERRIRFESVAKAFLDGNCDVIWSGLQGACCNEANCISPCSGNHMGLVVSAKRSSSSISSGSGGLRELESRELSDWYCIQLFGA